MNSDQRNSLIRTALKLIGAALASHGYTSTGNFLAGEAVIGLVVALAGVAASLNWHKTPTDNSSPPPPKPPGTLQTLLLVIFVGSGLLFTPGCGTPQAKVYQAEGVTIHTVDLAMQLWADHARAGKATAEQIAQVKAAYLTYYHAQQIARAALAQWIATGRPADADAAAAADATVARAVAAVTDLIKLHTR